MRSSEIYRNPHPERVGTTQGSTQTYYQNSGKIESATKLTLMQALCSQLHHIDSGKASKAERLKNDILLWMHYTKDIEELELMKGLVIEVATMKARKALRASKTV